VGSAIAPRLRAPGSPACRAPRSPGSAPCRHRADRWRAARGFPRGFSTGHPRGPGRGWPPEPQHHPAAFRCRSPRRPDRPLRAGRRPLRRIDRHQRLPPARCGGWQEGRRRGAGPAGAAGGPAQRWQRQNPRGTGLLARARQSGTPLLDAPAPLPQQPRLAG